MDSRYSSNRQGKEKQRVKGDQCCEHVFLANWHWWILIGWVSIHLPNAVFCATQHRVHFEKKKTNIKECFVLLSFFFILFFILINKLSFLLLLLYIVNQNKMLLLKHNNLSSEELILIERVKLNVYRIPKCALLTCTLLFLMY
jgi:hypothetical protein